MLGMASLTSWILVVVGEDIPKYLFLIQLADKESNRLSTFQQGEK
jgi:hypothetical protein